MADRDIAVKFTGDTKDLEQASDKAEKSLGGAAKGIGGAFSTLAGPAAVLGGAVVGLGAAAVGFADAALEDDAAAQNLAHSLKQAAGASDEAVQGAEDYISALSKSAAIADDELRPALATLATATGDTTKAQELLGLATDISAGTGKDLGTVSDALAKAQLGNVGALSKLGLATKDATGKTMGLDDILASAKGKFEGAGEAAANTAAGGLKKAKIQFGELQESIGAKLLPALGAAGTFMVDTLIPAFEKVVAWVEEQWPKLLEIIGPTLDAARVQVTMILDGILAFWNQWGDTILTVLRTLFQAWVTELRLVFEVVQAVVSFIAGKISEFWDAWGETIVSTLSTIAATVIEWGTAFVAGIQVVGDALSSFWNEWGDEITAFVRQVVDLVTGLVTRVLAIVKGAMDVTIAIIRFSLDVIGSAIKFATDVIRFVWSIFGDSIMAVVRTVFGIVVDVIQFAMQTVVNIVKFFTAIFRGDWEGALNAVLDIVRAFVELLGNIMGRIGGLMADAVRGVAELISRPFKAAFNIIVDAWNNTIGKLSFTFPDWIPGLGGNTIDVPDLPHFEGMGVMAGMTIIMPPGSDGYDVARQAATFSRNVAPITELTVSVR